MPYTIHNYITMLNCLQYEELSQKQKLTVIQKVDISTSFLAFLSHFYPYVSSFKKNNLGTIFLNIELIKNILTEINKKWCICHKIAQKQFNFLVNDDNSRTLNWIKQRIRRITFLTCYYIPKSSSCISHVTLFVPFHLNSSLNDLHNESKLHFLLGYQIIYL
jgi:hypothetical protein